MPFRIDDQEYYENINLTREEFFEKLKNDHDIATSQPSMEDVMKVWDELLETCDQIVHVPLSSGLSGSTQTAMMLAQDEKYEGRVFVPDDRGVSVVQRQAAIFATELAARGYDGQQICDILNRDAEQNQIYVGVDTLKYLKKGGRITPMAAAALFLLWKEPFMLFGAGFQLSFLAILAIGLCHVLPAPKHPLLEGLWLSFYLQLLTLPVILFHYFRFPLYGIFLNLIVLPLMGCVIYSGMFGVGLFGLSEKLATIAVGGGHWILRLYTLLCTHCAALPYSSLLLGRPSMHSILLYYTALGVVTWALAERRATEHSGLAACRVPLPCIVLPLLLSMLCLPAKQPQGLEITALDVGQGDGFILRTQGLVMSVDGGSTSDQRLGENVLGPYLESQGIGHIDLALITHCDADHYSGIQYRLEEESKMTIGELLLPRVAVQDARYDALRDAAAARDVRIRYFGQGDCIDLGEVEIRGYYPAGTERLEAANDHSIGMLLRAPDFQMLFTGDMDEDCERQMLAALWEDNAGYPKIDVLKAGHHGSHTSTSEALLTALRPDYAILSYGVGNDYGHPHAETRERLRRYGVEMLETGKMGEIRLTV